MPIEDEEECFMASLQLFSVDDSRGRKKSISNQTPLLFIKW